jgi:hypothetical protein
MENPVVLPEQPILETKYPFSDDEDNVPLLTAAPLLAQHIGGSLVHQATTRLSSGIHTLVAEATDYTKRASSGVNIKVTDYTYKDMHPYFFLVSSSLIGLAVAYSYNVYNDWYYTRTLKIQYTESELALREEKIPGWFDAFYQATNEKKGIQREVEGIFKLLDSPHVVPTDPKLQSTYFNNIEVVLDIGCCSGDLHTRIAESLNKAILLNNKINYIGLDKSPQAIAKVKADFAKSPELYSKLLPQPHQLDFFTDNQFESNYFKDLLSKLGSKTAAHLIIASHIAYYAPNITSFVHAMLSTIHPQKGFAIFIHESETSVAKLMAEKYNAPINAKTSPMIQWALKGELNNIEIYHKTIYGTIYLPIGIKTFTDYWNNGTKIPENISDNFTTTQNLLEFIFQVPFETLRGKGLGAELTEDLNLLAHANNNQIVIKSNLEFITPIGFEITKTTLKKYGFYEDWEDHIIQDRYYAVLNSKDNIQYSPEDL